ncbi:MAG: hypothetical protein ACE5R4_14060 [Armatimonadota bacterium]
MSEVDDRGPTDAAFLRERDSFHRLKAELLPDHGGKYAAVYQGEVTVIGDSSIEVAREAYEKHGYVPLYIGLVAEDDRVVRVSSPRLSAVPEARRLW